MGTSSNVFISSFILLTQIIKLDMSKNGKVGVSTSKILHTDQ